jgi:hypothetical protein
MLGFASLTANLPQLFSLQDIVGWGELCEPQLWPHQHEIMLGFASLTANLPQLFSLQGIVGWGELCEPQLLATSARNYVGVRFAHRQPTTTVFTVRFAAFESQHTASFADHGFKG